MTAKGLTPEQQAQRDGKLTASQVNILINGHDEDVLNLWRMHVGDPDYKADDLSCVWPVQLGIHTEGLNLEWYSLKQRTDISRIGDVVVHPKNPWMACTLDAWDNRLGCPIECKHVGGHNNMRDVIKRYQPQLHWQMMCTGALRAQLSVIIGSKEPEVCHVKYDDRYAKHLFTVAENYWKHVQSMTPPVSLPTVDAPEHPDELKEVDMQGNNQWAALAYDWLQNKDASKKFDDSSKELKNMISNDVGKAFGHGIEIKRSKSNALTIRKAKQ